MEREYVVSLKKDVNYDEFWNEIENVSDSDGFVPSRRVDIVNNRDGSLRSCHYALSDTEAEQLRSDPRVYAVEIPVDQRPDVFIGHRATQVGNFTKKTNTNSSGNFLNFGLRRCISDTNPYGTNTTVTGDYTYPLDGTGVDIVIQDSGLQVDHPEFQDANGVSRVQQINWYTAAGNVISGVQSANFYRDFDGHGTHCGGIAAGKTYGWAKNAQIYSMKLQGLEGPGDSGTGIPITQTFDLIKLWHNLKPIDPNTGYKRPTVVNMSWGFFSTFTDIVGGVYRTDPWTGNSRRTDYGMIGQFDGSNFTFDTQALVVDVDIEEMLDAGIHIVVSAGNSSMKIDVAGGVDYGNYFTAQRLGSGGQPVFIDYFYHQGGSPYGNNAFIVGSSDSVVFNTTTEQKSTFSNCGKGVTLYAPGSRIMSATSTTNQFSNNEAYYADTNFKQLNLSGTSMAAPQVAGLAALMLQLDPKLTPAQLKAKIVSDSRTVMYSTNLDNDYTNNRSISDGEPRFLYQKYNSSQPYSISGGISTTNIELDLK
jgi:subtilisin family serine protease